MAEISARPESADNGCLLRDMPEGLRHVAAGVITRAASRLKDEGTLRVEAGCRHAATGREPQDVGSSVGENPPTRKSQEGQHARALRPRGRASEAEFDDLSAQRSTGALLEALAGGP